ncbi:MAG: SpoIIE family protein phosphatase [Flavobacteriales bacterium]|nr:SpoIIE family protein phosphatase [Flavobacteriales bacterium]
MPIFIVGQDMRFTSVEGTQSVINTMLEDNMGYIWAGTQDGLYRYDGYEFKTFKRIPNDTNSLSDNFIWCLHQSNNGLIWVGTNGGGLNYYNPITNKFFRFASKSDNDVLTSGIIKCITEDKSGNLYLGTESGLYIYNHTSKKTEHYTEGSNGLKNNRVFSVLIDIENNVWVGTFGGGLHLFQKETKKFIQYLDVLPSGNLLKEESVFIRSLFQDKFGNLWVGTGGAGLQQFNIKSRKFNEFVDPGSGKAVGIYHINQSEDDRLWIASMDGLFIYDFATKEFTHYYHEEDNPYSLSNNRIRFVLIGKNNINWIGTDGMGINVYKKLSNQFKHYTKNNRDSLPLVGNEVMAFCEDSEENIWIATLDGISVCDKNKKVIKNYRLNENKIHDRILSLHVDREGLIWIGSWGGGINFYNPETEEFSKPFNTENPINNTSIMGNTILDIEEDNYNNIWIATLDGLSVYNKNEQKFINYTTLDGLTSNSINCIYYDSLKNTLWIGTNNGVNIFDIHKRVVTEKIQSKGKEGELSNNTIYSINKDSKGFFWIASGNGLNKYDTQSKSVVSFYEKDGMSSDMIFSVIEDNEDNLWLTSGNGLIKFSPRNLGKDENLFKNYLPVDGIQDKEFNQGAYYKCNDGEILIGGVNGYNAFYPLQIKTNTNPPKVYLTSFKIFEKEVALDTNIAFKKHLELSYQDKFFSFEFVALDYLFPSKNLYSYKLEGLDDEWSPPSNRRFVSYSNLPGGNYVFRVRACNNDGFWNNEGTAIYIKIIPPFWKTNLFYATCILILILSVVVYNRLRTQKIKKEKKILEQKVKERTRELAEKNRDILSSIQYAKRIQEAILPPLEQIYQHFPKSFILYKPKDIVSGDFYWFAEKSGKKIIAAVDCTGHGVPGAFMSMIGHNILNQIVIENAVIDAAEILNLLNKAIITSLKQEGGNKQETRDGMDVALCVIDTLDGKVQFSGAYRPLYILRKNKLEKIEGNKFPIGGLKTVEDKTFSSVTVKLNEGETIYMFSDGYADQFGGAEGKKFMVKRFRDVLLEISDLSMKGQQRKLDELFNKWKGNYEQVDDILIIGIKF